MDARVILSAFAVSILIGCKDPLTGEELAGKYSLTRLDGRALPQLLTATLSCDESVQTGDLTLQQGGEFMLVVRGEQDCTRAGGQVQAVGWEYPGTFSIVGSTLLFTSPRYPSGEVRFMGRIDRWQTRVTVFDLELQLSKVVDLEFHR